MRPTPGRMFFYICVTARMEARENKTLEVEKTKIPSHQMNDSWGFNLFKI